MLLNECVVEAQFAFLRYCSYESVVMVFKKDCEGKITGSTFKWSESIGVANRGRLLPYSPSNNYLKWSTIVKVLRF